MSRRRSNSSSNIPILKVNLFESKLSKDSSRVTSRRSQSLSRLSQRDSASSTSQLRQPRKSSLDRKSSNLLGFPRTTPKTGGAGSLHRTTPTSALSQRTSKLSITPSSSITPSTLKDRKTIQKLATDKKWVAEQYAKVQNFIISSSLFDLTKMNVNSLKPPTINTFIYITAVLFKEIDPRMKVTNENYKEIVPAQLKVLQYPGTLSNSLLKTVNTLHSFPQVVGMWGWLIDRVNLGKFDEDESFLEDLEPEEKQQYLQKNLKKNCLEYVINRYTIFNKNESNEEAIQEVNDAYVNKLAQILEVDFDEFRRLEAEVLDKRQYKEKQEAEVEHLKDEQMKKQLEIEQMNNEIDEFYETDAVMGKNLDNELEILQNNLKRMRDSKVATKQSVNDLEEAIKVQPCTFKEKHNLLRKIDQFKDELKVKKETIEHAKIIKNKFDHMLTDEIKKMQNMVIQWNRSLRELSIQKPELKKLLLRERGFQDPEFLNEINEVLNHTISIENDILKALVEVDKDLKMKDEKKQELEKDIEELTRVADYTNQESLKLSDNVASIKREIKDLMINFEENKKIHDEQVAKLRENPEFKEQTELISKLKTKKDNLEVEVKNFSQKMLGFFIELHNQTTNTIKEMDSIRRSVTQNFEERVSKMVGKQKQLIEILKSFNNTTE